MKSIDDIAAEQQRASIAAGDDPALARALLKLLEVAEDACVARDRLDTALHLAAAGKPVTPEALDAFAPDEDTIAERLARHEAYFRQVFESMLDED